jgi:pyrimidine-specific ribonucleoside hydrolase
MRRAARSILAAAFAAAVAAPGILPAEEATRVWIDTDPSCGQPARDVDDCWALLLALSSPELDVVGVSSVFGNVDGETAHRTAVGFLRRLGAEGTGAAASPVVHRGAAEPIGRSDPWANEAAGAMVRALRASRDSGGGRRHAPRGGQPGAGPDEPGEGLTILALGPVTNIAALILREPELALRIERVVAVAGSRPGQMRFHVGGSGLMHLHDLNFRKDAEAFRILLDSRIPLTLVPFEAAEKVSLTAEDLSRVEGRSGTARWLCEASEDWLRTWKRWFGVEGFYPFDTLAVGYLVDPRAFRSSRMRARVQRRESLFVSRDTLVVDDEPAAGTTVDYVFDVNPRFRTDLIHRLAGPGT